MLRPKLYWTTILLIASVVALPGCVDFTTLFSSEFLAAVGGGAQVANLPGDAPAILLEIENATTQVVTVDVEYREDEDTVRSFTAVVQPQEQTAQALICPIREVTVGSLADPGTEGVLVLLAGGQLDANGIPVGPFVTVEPFGTILQEGINYDCGDAVTFSVRESAATRSGYRIFAFIRRAGAN
jgi:hypothetical protein